MSAFVASSVVASSVAMLGLFTPIYINIGVMWRAAVVFIVSENYFSRRFLPFVFYTLHAKRADLVLYMVVLFPFNT